MTGKRKNDSFEFNGRNLISSSGGIEVPAGCFKFQQGHFKFELGPLELQPAEFELRTKDIRISSSRLGNTTP